MSPPPRWWVPITVEMIAVGTLHLVWPSALEFLFGLAVFLFGIVAYTTSPAYAVEKIGWMLFPFRKTVYVVKREQKKSTKVDIPDGATIKDEDLSKPIPKPADPTPEELAQWARFDATKKKQPGRSVKMSELSDMFPDETPF